MLFAVRRELGAWLGWDDAEDGIGARVPSLRERLAPDRREAPVPRELGALPFRPVYATERELALETANRTVHAVLHVGWAPDPAGAQRGEMAVYARPEGLLGRAYMAAIRPFRRAIVYPAMLREIARRWGGGGGGGGGAGTG